MGFSEPSDSEFIVTVTPVFQSDGEMVTVTGEIYLVPDTPLPEAVRSVAYVDVYEIVTSTSSVGLAPRVMVVDVFALLPAWSIFAGENVENNTLATSLSLIESDNVDDFPLKKSSEEDEVETIETDLAPLTKLSSITETTIVCAIFQSSGVNVRVLISNETALVASVIETETDAFGLDESLTVKEVDCPSVLVDALNADWVIDAESTSTTLIKTKEPALPTEDEHTSSVHTPTESYRESVEDGVKIKLDRTKASFSKILSATGLI